MYDKTKIFWKIDKIEVLPNLNGLTYSVKRVVYQVSAECQETGELTSFMGEAVLLDANEKSFIPFFELDENTVLSWVKSSIGTQTVHDIEMELLQNLSNIVAPKLLEMDLPWELKERDKVITFKNKKKFIKK